MRVVVTGGLGFIGSAACRYLLLNKGYEVLNIDKVTYVANMHFHDDISADPAYRFAQADICNRRKLDSLFAEFTPDAVLHLAAETHVDRSIAGSEDFIRANIIGTHVLLEATRSYWSQLPRHKQSAFRFIHVSTDEVYGSLGVKGSFAEHSAYDPNSPYAASKAASDHLVSAWHSTYGLPTIISNCGNNYGPYQFPEKLIPLIILNALEGKQLPVYGDGQNVRDWIFVEDHAIALALLLVEGRVGQRYNIGARNERTNIQVVHSICDILDELVAGKSSYRNLIQLVPDRPGHDRRYAIDPTKIENELGWRPLSAFEAGLQETVRWYIDNEAWWRPLRDHVYGGERIGLIDA